VVSHEARGEPVMAAQLLTPALAKQLGVPEKTGKPTLFQIHRKDARLFVAIQVPGKSQG
jgi:hypothetical protein